MKNSSGSSKTVRYAVVGLGHFAQVAVLPGFRRAGRTSQLSALVSSDPRKLQEMSRLYKISRSASYDQYDALLQSGEIDAVYIVLPNSLHREYAVRALRAGIHVLCEKPMATTVDECRAINEAAEEGRAKLMIAYRLHFEAGTLDVVEQVKKGVIGDPRFFSSVFSHQVQPGNIRTREDVGGGALYDIGVYCINAARYLFRAEPTQVFAITTNSDPKRFKGVDEAVTATLVFPGQRTAQFTASQGAGDTSQYRIVGTRGDINVDPAYEYVDSIEYTVTVKGQSKKRKAPKSDQIGAEIAYFSQCVVKNKNPEPSGQEGLADVKIIEALYRSAKTGLPIDIAPTPKRERPSARQRISLPPHGKPEMVHVASPSKE